jgi:hypothetical protein
MRQIDNDMLRIDDFNVMRRLNVGRAGEGSA